LVQQALLSDPVPSQQVAGGGNKFTGAFGGGVSEELNDILF